MVNIMKIVLENNKLKITISSKGSEVTSILGKKDQTEYLWTADPAYWAEHAPLMFPACGLLKDGRYTYDGKNYEMGIHGFGRHQEFTLIHQSQQEVTLRMDINGVEAMYPFRFTFETTHRLEDHKLTTTYKVTNEGEKTMYFGIGGHPGFNIPMHGEGTFEDYELTFEKPDQLEKLVMVKGLMTEETEKYPVEEGGKVSLQFGKFGVSGTFLQNMGSWVELSSTISSRKVKLESKDMKYLGMWQQITPTADTPYLCLEPWASVPSYYDRDEELTAKRDMTVLQPGETSTYSYSIIITE